MRYLEILQHTDGFDDEGAEARRLAAHLVVMLYRASDFAVSAERAHEYQAEDFTQGADAAP